MEYENRITFKSYEQSYSFGQIDKHTEQKQYAPQSSKRGHINASSLYEP